MAKWYCYECKRADGGSNGPCIYIDPIGEMHYPPISCSLNDAKWVRKKCVCCGEEM